jgi:hypothetical protein
MNQGTLFLLEFARCRRGHHTPIRTAKTASPIEDQKSTETENDPEFFVCNECRKIFPIEDENLVTLPGPSGLEPYNPGAPIRRFVVSLRCDEELNCPPIRVIAVLKSDTTAEQLEKEIATWSGRALRCPNGHLQNFPSDWV